MEVVVPADFDLSGSWDMNKHWIAVAISELQCGVRMVLERAHRSDVDIVKELGQIRLELAEEQRRQERVQGDALMEAVKPLVQGVGELKVEIAGLKHQGSSRTVLTTAIAAGIPSLVLVMYWLLNHSSVGAQ